MITNCFRNKPSDISENPCASVASLKKLWLRLWPRRVHAYLARMLPAGKNDHLLLAYGLRKKFRRGHSKPQVTVVNEDAVEEESTPETS